MQFSPDSHRGVTSSDYNTGSSGGGPGSWLQPTQRARSYRAITHKIHAVIARDFPLHPGLEFASFLSPRGTAKTAQRRCDPRGCGSIQRTGVINCVTRGVREVVMWNRRDWDDFFDIVKKRWSTHRPPRPVYSSGRNRLTPAEGYSLSELDDAGVSIEQAEILGVPVDAGRIGSHGNNVMALREFVRASRSRF